MVVVKSCGISRGPRFHQAERAGVVDKRFASLARGAGFPIEILHKDEIEAMRGLLYQV